ncbi:hypothetical protein Glove_606g20 [Diversispora epigaea]|uniref:Uncharacterized protein n=1 Tax=Diversispora epigaea TaxID=1348612 RepID=A0A397G8F3_9GLOM|nr:hypothetical protein Glove_606g20 [Diversispora epigaea]
MSYLSINEETEVSLTSKTVQNVPFDQGVQNDSDNVILVIENTSKSSKGKPIQNGSDNQDDKFLTPELKKVYKKLDRKMKERYRRYRTDEEKIILLETVMHERKKGKYEINSVFNAISVLNTIAITVTAKYIKDENFTKFFI